METRWEQLVIFDYERDLPHAAPAELELYSRGLLRFPGVLTGRERRVGRQRRPGIADLDALAYDETVTALHAVLFDLPAVAELKQRMTAVLTAADKALADAERDLAAGRGVLELGALIDRLLDVMALHVVNWLWPLEEFEDHLARVLNDRQLGRRCLLSLMVPTRPAHMLDFQSHLLAAAAHVGAEATIGTAPALAVRRRMAARLAEEIGFLQGWGVASLTARDLEDPDAAAELLADLAQADPQLLEAQRSALSIAHQRATRMRSAMYAAALAASTTSAESWRITQAVSIACRIAADAEEIRKVIQNRCLRLLRHIAAARRQDFTDLGLNDIAHAARAAVQQHQEAVR